MANKQRRMISIKFENLRSKKWWNQEMIDNHSYNTGNLVRHSCRKSGIFNIQHSSLSLISSTFGVRHSIFLPLLNRFDIRCSTFDIRYSFPLINNQYFIFHFFAWSKKWSKNSEASEQAHSLPDCATQAGMRYSHRARTFPLMNAQILQVDTLALSENHKAP